MNLAFSTKFPDGKSTKFIEKIWYGFAQHAIINDEDSEKWVYDEGSILEYNLGRTFDFTFGSIHHNGKIHTIREDPKERWREGMDIHFIINPRSKDRFQFAPVVKCTGKQKIEIYYLGFRNTPAVLINGTIQKDDEIEKLALNDGFDTVADFYKWFDKDFEGWIIHWTPFRYDVNEIDVIDSKNCDSCEIYTKV